MQIRPFCLLPSLATSCKYFNETTSYNNNETLSFEDVKPNLPCKGKFYLEVLLNDKVRGLSVRLDPLKKGK